MLVVVCGSVTVCDHDCTGCQLGGGCIIMLDAVASRFSVVASP